MWGKAPLDLRCPAPAIATRQGGDRLRAPGAYAMGALKSATGALASRARRWPGMFRPAGVRACMQRERKERKQNKGDNISSSSSSLMLILERHHPEHDSRRWRDRARSARYRHRLPFFFSLWPGAGRPARGAGPRGQTGPARPAAVRVLVACCRGLAGCVSRLGLASRPPREEWPGGGISARKTLW